MNLTLHVEYFHARQNRKKAAVHAHEKNNVRRNVNSGFSIVTMRRVAIVYFELGVAKKFLQKIYHKKLITRHFMISVFLCLEVVHDCNIVIYQYPSLSEICFIKNILKKPS